MVHCALICLPLVSTRHTGPLVSTQSHTSHDSLRLQHKSTALDVGAACSWANAAAALGFARIQLPLMSARSRSRVLSLYRSILRTAREWTGPTEVRVRPSPAGRARSASRPWQLAATAIAAPQEQQYIRNEAKTVFRANRGTSDAQQIKEQVRNGAPAVPLLRAGQRPGFDTRVWSSSMISTTVRGPQA